MKNRRHYFLSLDSFCLDGCRFCDRAGCQNSKKRTLVGLEEIFHRALSGGYSHVEFASNLLLQEDSSKILELLLQYNLKPVIQIDYACINTHPAHLEMLSRFQPEWNILLDEADGKLALFRVAGKKVYFSFFPRTINGSLVFLKTNQEHLQQLHFHATPFSKLWPALTARELHVLFEKLRKNVPGFSPNPPLGREVWDPRIDPDLKLDASLIPVIESEMEKCDTFFSVIIPTFNSKLLVKSVIHHLLDQDYDRKRFEIIVIDDGSSDGTQEYIRNFLSPEFGSFQFRYFYFPRNKARSRGDGNFRAGIARNQGVKAAKGKYLCFLDSDIIVPSHFLRNLEEKHRQYDVIQNIRLHLKNRKGNESLRYADVNPKKDTYIQEAGYWGRLFETKSWESLPFFWKYTCTYSLSLPKELFQRVGWFRKTFVYYGFEDTDLGYRLWREGAKFFLNPLITYHLETSEDRTEYKRSAFERHAVLSKTAKIFYLNNLHSDVFLHFYSMMGGEKSAFEGLMKRISKIRKKKGDERLTTTNRKSLEKSSLPLSHAALLTDSKKNVDLH